MLGWIQQTMNAPLPTAWTRRAQDRAAAREAGKHAASAGLSRDVNPWRELTEIWRSWNAGWRGHHNDSDGS